MAASIDLVDFDPDTALIPVLKGENFKQIDIKSSIEQASTGNFTLFLELR